MARLSDLVRIEAAKTSDRTVAVNGLATGPHAGAVTDNWGHAAGEALHRIQGNIRDGVSPSMHEWAPLARDLVRLLRADDACLQHALSGRTEHYHIDNARHVAVFAVKVGLGLGYDNGALETLALAGLLHDLGMWTLPQSLLMKAGPLSSEERVLLHAHPEKGRRLLAAMGTPYTELADICAQEHERCDGSGYPCRLRGTHITEPAQIIGIADTFDAFITPRPYRKPIAPHIAVRELLVHGKALFSHRVLKAFADAITFYPVGTTVRLNTGHVASVTRTTPRYPLRPTVMLRAQGEPSGGGPGEEWNLVQRTTAHIVEVLPPSVAVSEPA